MTTFDLLVVILLILIAILLPFIYARVLKTGREVHLRPLPPIEAIESALARAAETGRPLHLSPGAGALHSSNYAPESFAGLMTAQRIAASAAQRGALVITSSGDAVTYLALRGAIHASYYDAGYSEDYNPQSMHLYADHDPLAFAAGVGQRYATDDMESSILVGDFGQSYLLLGEQGQQQGVPQIGGTVNAVSLAASTLTSHGTLYGEEIYAAEVYITPTPVGLARLLTHDLLRYILIGLIVASIILLSLSDLGFIDANSPLLPR